MSNYKPVFKRQEDEISKKVEDKVKTEIHSKIKNEVDEKLKARTEGLKAEVVAKVDERIKEETDKVRNDIDNKYKVEVEARVLSILKEKEEKEKSDKATKLAKAVDVAKTFKGESETDKEKAERAEKAEKERERFDHDTLCPGPACHKDGKVGHIHRVETEKSGMVYKCDDKGCSFEAVLVPKTADYKCVGCSAPIKKPEKDEIAKEMSCPFCGSKKKAIRYDWSKVWDVVNKNKT
jgi:DNA-directed RNA polymerase subunit RPC12/RpoP